MADVAVVRLLGLLGQRNYALSVPMICLRQRRQYMSVPQVFRASFARSEQILYVMKAKPEHEASYNSRIGGKLCSVMP